MGSSPGQATPCLDLVLAATPGQFAAVSPQEAPHRSHNSTSTCCSRPQSDDDRQRVNHRPAHLQLPTSSASATASRQPPRDSWSPERACRHGTVRLFACACAAAAAAVDDDLSRLSMAFASPATRAREWTPSVTRTHGDRNHHRAAPAVALAVALSSRPTTTRLCQRRPLRQ